MLEAMDGSFLDNLCPGKKLDDLLKRVEQLEAKLEVPCQTCHVLKNEWLIANRNRY